MPKCEGRPDGPCPLGVNNSTVKLTQGDLMLCKQCDAFRFPIDKVISVQTDKTFTDKVPVQSSAANDDPVPQATVPEKKLIVSKLLCFLANKYDNYPIGWLRSTVVERRSLAGELTLSCARPAADW